MPLVRSALAAAGSVPCQSHSLTKSRGRFWGEHRYICCAWTWLVKVSWRVAQVVEHEGKRDAAGARASSFAGLRGSRPHTSVSLLVLSSALNNIRYEICAPPTPRISARATCGATPPFSHLGPHRSPRRHWPTTYFACPSCAPLALRQLLPHTPRSAALLHVPFLTQNHCKRKNNEEERVPH